MVVNLEENVCLAATDLVFILFIVRPGQSVPTTVLFGIGFNRRRVSPAELAPNLPETPNDTNRVIAN